MNKEEYADKFMSRAKQDIKICENEHELQVYIAGLLENIDYWQNEYDYMKKYRDKLQQQNKDLKEDRKFLFEENHNKEQVIIKYQDLCNKLKEHIQECLNEVSENDVYDRTSYEQGIIAGLESSLFKLEELENGDNNV